MNNLKYWEEGNKRLFDYGFQDPIKNKIIGECVNMTEWKKVEKDVFKFEKEGDNIEGELILVEDGKAYDNKVYTIKTDKKELVVFGTTVLDSQMATVPIGKMVRIVFSGIKKSEVKGRNDTKLFDVFVKDK